MRRTLAPLLALCALVTMHSVSRGQNGPDTDPDAAPGYARACSTMPPSIRSTSTTDRSRSRSPSGPPTRSARSSRSRRCSPTTRVVWEFGNPGPDDQSDVGLYEPIKADPSLAVGWSLHRRRDQALRRRPELELLRRSGRLRAPVRPVAGRELLPHERRQPAAAALARRGRLRDVGRRRQPLRLRLARRRLRRRAAELHLRPRPGPQRLVPDEPDGPVRQRDHASTTTAASAARAPAGPATARRRPTPGSCTRSGAGRRPCSRSTSGTIPGRRGSRTS